jgi:hypothetical protein
MSYNNSYISSDSRLSGREVTGKCAVENCEASTGWNCDINGGDNLCHKSII